MPDACLHVEKEGAGDHAYWNATEVKAGRCECPAGLGGFCVHVAQLLWVVVNLPRAEGSSVPVASTSRLCAWVVPADGPIADARVPVMFDAIVQQYYGKAAAAGHSTARRDGGRARFEALSQERCEAWAAANPEHVRQDSRNTTRVAVQRLDAAVTARARAAFVKVLQVVQQATAGRPGAAMVTLAGYRGHQVARGVNTGFTPLPSDRKSLRKEDLKRRRREPDAEHAADGVGAVAGPVARVVEPAAAAQVAPAAPEPPRRPVVSSRARDVRAAPSPAAARSPAHRSPARACAIQSPADPGRGGVRSRSPLGSDYLSPLRSAGARAGGASARPSPASRDARVLGTVTVSATPRRSPRHAPAAAAAAATPAEPAARRRIGFT